MCYSDLICHARGPSPSSMSVSSTVLSASTLCQYSLPACSLAIIHAAPHLHLHLVLFLTTCFSLNSACMQPSATLHMPFATTPKCAHVPCCAQA